MFILGVCIAVLIGVSLGLLGGGGSILTVPTIHYIFGVETHAAIASSLLIVGTTSLAALVPHVCAGHVRPRIGLIFGVSSMVSAYGASRLSSHVAPGILLVAFGAMMAVAAIAMLRPERALTPRAASPVGLVTQGLAVGAVTGFVGAGGGFMIVPALVVLVGLPMQQAIATSLLVITMNSFVAFGAAAHAVSLNGRVIGAVLAAAIGGAVVGSLFAGRVPPARLRRWFGWFVLIMAIVILGAEVPGLLRR